VEEARPILLELLKNRMGVPDIRVAAGYLDLAGLHDEAVTVLLAIEDAAGSSFSRIATARSLIAMGAGDRALPLLRGVNATDLDAVYRHLLKATLATLETKEDTVEALSAVAADANIDARKRIEAAKRLASFGSQDLATPTLRRLMQKAGSGSARLEAAITIGELGFADEAERVMVEVADTAGSKLRIKVGQALSDLHRKPAAAEILVSVATDDSVNPLERIRALGQLGKLGEVASASSLLERFAFDLEFSPDIQLAAVRSLDEMGKATKAVAALRQFVQQVADHGLRIVAAQELGQLGEVKAAQLLLEGMVTEQDDPKISLRAAKALSDLGLFDTAASIMRSLLGEPDVASQAESELESLGCRTPIAIGK
jgi:hypothetical protein